MNSEELAERIARQLADYHTKKLHLNLAEKMAAAARQKAEEMAIPISIAVVDAGGNLLLHQRMDGALLVSIGASLQKAHTAASLALSTQELTALSAPEGELYGLHTLAGGQYCVFGGGFPVFNGDELIGGIGVSGGSVSQDVQIARWAFSACPEFHFSKK